VKRGNLMDTTQLRILLEQVQAGSVNPTDALEILKQLPYTDLGFAKVDHHRKLRTGVPEVIFCQGKTPEQVLQILTRLTQMHQSPILATRANEGLYQYVKHSFPSIEYHALARCLVTNRQYVEDSEGRGQILVVSAGTADMPVAEEAAITAEILGNPVERLYDVGVAGIHRLLSNHNVLANANVIIVVAGMEGALASVVGGMVDKPVVAVPTSVGYGASFGGLAALLAMLNSCAAGIGVVNIDNGFGAAYLAHQINRVNGGKP
jgi:pyridinium-3,5-biscarboxylic acid mononucleotide synthase